MTSARDLYETLQVHHSAEPEVIESAYRRLARMYHPDVNPDPAAARYMQEINSAYENLKDPVKRAQYDRSRQGQSAPFGQKRQEQTRSGTPRSPNDANAHGDRGWSYLLQGQLEEAIEEANEAIRIDPNLAKAYEIRGKAYFRLGRHKEAMANLKKASQLRAEQK